MPPSGSLASSKLTAGCAGRDGLCSVGTDGIAAALASAASLALVVFSPRSCSSRPARSARLLPTCRPTSWPCWSKARMAGTATTPSSDSRAWGWGSARESATTLAKCTLWPPSRKLRAMPTNAGYSWMQRPLLRLPTNSTLSSGERVRSPAESAPLSLSAPEASAKTAGSLGTLLLPCTCTVAAGRCWSLAVRSGPGCTPAAIAAAGAPAAVGLMTEEGCSDAGMTATGTVAAGSTVAGCSSAGSTSRSCSPCDAKAATAWLSVDTTAVGCCWPAG
ncbi:hypothetical protein V8C86DRAFT_2601471 [Haematococcus lacustris]